MRGQILGYKSPIQTHECVLERRHNTGLLERHSEYHGSWRAVCIFCQFVGRWEALYDANRVAETHAAWAALAPESRDIRPITLESLLDLRCILSGDTAFLTEEVSCRLGRHKHNDIGRLACSCARDAQAAQVELERAEPMDADASRARLRRLDADHQSAFSAGLASHRPYLTTLTGPRSVINPILDLLERGGHVVRRHQSLIEPGYSPRGERIVSWQTTATSAEVPDCAEVNVTSSPTP